MRPDGFVSDGCTGFVDTWRGIDLYWCCEAHDFAWHSHPGDWGRWFAANIDLALCLANSGAWELAIPALMLVSSVGALLFAGIIVLKDRRRGRP